ncbi:MAG: glycosyltransferase family 2 protein [Alphaproteobacteria bacterium]
MLSFVIPAYNEQDNIAPLTRRIEIACANAGIEAYEVLYVENGSNDATESAIRDAHSRNNRVKFVQLSRNFGYQGAITAGLTFANGDWVAILDGDQQDPPELILEMLKKAKEGYEVIYGVRIKRQERWLKRTAYRMFYRLWRSLSDVAVPLDAGEFCVLNRRVVNVINRLPERQRFVRGLRAWSGFRQAGMPYVREARGEGESKFRFSGMLNLAMDGLLAYSVVPLHLMFFAGLIVTALSLFVTFINLIVWLLDQLGVHSPVGLLPTGLTQLTLMFTFLFGVVILFLGTIGAYVGRIYEEVKARPHFIVQATLGDLKLDNAKQ